MQIPFGEWLPDQPPHLNPGATVATNVYYAVNSYKPFPSLISYSSTAGGGLANIGKDSKGAGSFRSTENLAFNFAATKDTIYQLTSGSFIDRGASGKLLSNSFATCTITVTDYANIGAGKL